jgi:ketosteroid isomerase-like protein
MAAERSTERVAARIRVALENADLAEFADLLDPHVRWGAPGDPAPPCQDREQVLRWYRQGRADGVRARVVEVCVNENEVLVALKVLARSSAVAPSETDRWQVLTVADGRVVDIRGYQSRDEASIAAGITP